MKFQLVGAIAIKVIASGVGVRIRSYLRKTYGAGSWRKMKGIAVIRLPNGKRDLKIKRYVSGP